MPGGSLTQKATCPLYSNNHPPNYLGCKVHKNPYKINIIPRRQIYLKTTASTILRKEFPLINNSTHSQNKMFIYNSNTQQQQHNTNSKDNLVKNQNFYDYSELNNYTSRNVYSNFVSGRHYNRHSDSSRLHDFFSKELNNLLTPILLLITNLTQILSRNGP